MVDKGGRVFISALEREDAELCVEVSDCVSCDLCLSHLPPHTVCQAITGHNLQPAERNAFFVVLRRLAECHRLLPDRMRIKEKVKVSDQVHASGGFGDLRSQLYMGRRAAVKTAKNLGLEDLQKMKQVTNAQRKRRLDEIQKIRKVGFSGVFAPTWGVLTILL